MTENNQAFSNRWGLILTSLGMAVGAGNLWRFPRLAGQYGGTFIVLWLFFLLIWSIPILMAEFSIGKKYKKNVISSFAATAGQRFSWMGFFILFCTLGIAFYYSVVVAWGIRFWGWSLEYTLNAISYSGPIIYNEQYFSDFWGEVSNSSFTTIGFHAFAIAAGMLVLWKGVQKGLEKASRILIPTLFVLLILIMILALNQENGIQGLNYMFKIRSELFMNPVVWIEALTQSAWSTGAGWGLIMTIASYSKKKEDVSLNIMISGFGNNLASLVCGMAILPSVFALAENPQSAIQLLKSGNQALTFTIIPNLFVKIQGGELLSVLFFSAFTLAAFTSLLTMLEMFLKLITDMGLSRNQALVMVGLLCFIFGTPSAWSLDIFTNQDWVWGVGLILSGIFIMFAVLRVGAEKFKQSYIDPDSDFQFSTRFFKAVVVLNIPMGLALIYWWLSQGYSEYPWFDEAGSWNWLDVYSNATVITQWALVLFLGGILGKYFQGKNKGAVS
ncbi:sodium-dependent transporter [Persicobacter diffluens]|uniref:Sodium:calcium symporter n=1 Tax=Persicobacter diffluens TaxID=981 RepID=A0AAN4W2F9_9BACT|nr:sodium:calcium symporter [Persicobacter diffluens]